MTAPAARDQTPETGGKPVFDWRDPLLLEDELSEDERLVRDAARGYCQGKLLPRVKSAFREERFARILYGREPTPAGEGSAGSPPSGPP